MNRRFRVIPSLLVDDERLVKTVRFRDPRYIGDPVNAIRIFNEKEVDELVLLDISATREGRGPNLKLVSEVATECFMPLCYGGGVKTLDDVGALFSAGVEKVSLNDAAFRNPGLVTAAAKTFGCQSIVASIDVRRAGLAGHRVHIDGGRLDTGLGPVEYAKRLEGLGAGEILLTSVDKEGSRAGYDIPLVESVAASVGIPVIACGGAGSVSDLAAAMRAGASAAAAGSLFVFWGRLQAVLINFPSQAELEASLAPETGGRA